MSLINLLSASISQVGKNDYGILFHDRYYWDTLVGFDRIGRMVIPETPCAH